MYRRTPQADPYLEGLFLNDIAHVNPQRIAWLDEVGVDNDDMAHRRRGRSVQGERAFDRGIRHNREHFSCVAAMTKDGVLCHSTVRGAMNSEQLHFFLAGSLLDDMKAAGKDYLKIDNCSVHKSDAFLQLCADAGVTVLFLPPYSPWLNPIEAVFKCVKAFLHRHILAYLAQGHSSSQC